MAQKPIKIGNKQIGPNEPIFIIAEAGVNHNGNLDMALELVDVAAEAGADCIKFQTFKAEQVVTKKGKMADYQKKNIGKTESQLEMIKKLELPEEFYPPIIKRCKEKGIIFSSAPHGGIESAKLLMTLGLPFIKVGSGDLTNKPFLDYLASLDIPLIISTGMSSMKEVVEADLWLRKAGAREYVFLHCTTNYPCPLDEVNLSAMKTMMERFPNVLIGYSDHTLGYEVVLAATACGARVIEKHLTLDKNLLGPDHVASSDPEEFTKVVGVIRNVEKILGSPEKKPNPSEEKIMKVARKSIVSIRDIKKGEKLDPSNIGVKRPGGGIDPKKFEDIIGKTAKKDIKGDSLLTRDVF